MRRFAVMASIFALGCDPSVRALVPVRVTTLTPAACPDCDDGEGCTVDQCAPGGCRHLLAQDGTICNQGDPCFQGSVCKAGKCGAPPEPSCGPQLGGPDDDTFFAVAARADSHVFLAGQRGEPGLGDQGWLVHVDAKDAVVWQRTLGGKGDDRLFALRLLANGLVAAGRRTVSGGGRGWLLQIDASGQVVDERTVDCPALGASSTADGGWAFVDNSITRVTGNGAILWKTPGLGATAIASVGTGFVAALQPFGWLRLGSDGQILGQGKLFAQDMKGAGFPTHLWGVLAVAGADALLLGRGHPGPWADARAARLRADGSLGFDVRFGGDDFEEAWAGATLAGGGQLVVGRQGTGAAFQAWDALLDDDGRLLGQHLLDGSHARAVAALPGGGAVVAGAIEDNHGRDGWFRRVSAWGDANPGGGCEPLSVNQCADDKPCTVDTCLRDQGCVHLPAVSGASCSQGTCQVANVAWWQVAPGTQTSSARLYAGGGVVLMRGVNPGLGYFDPDPAGAGDWRVDPATGTLIGLSWPDGVTVLKIERHGGVEPLGVAGQRNGQAWLGGLAAGGGLSWQATLNDGEILGIDAGPGGTFALFGWGSLRRFDAKGTPSWALAAPLASDLLATSDGGVLLSDGTHFDASGAVDWHIPPLDPWSLGLAAQYGVQTLASGKLPLDPGIAPALEALSNDDPLLSMVLDKPWWPSVPIFAAGQGGFLFATSRFEAEGAALRPVLAWPNVPPQPPSMARIPLPIGTVVQDVAVLPNGDVVLVGLQTLGFGNTGMRGWLARVNRGPDSCGKP